MSSPQNIHILSVKPIKEHSCPPYDRPLLPTKSGFIREVASLERGRHLVVFYSASQIWLDIMIL
jgi:hypothetical protein